MLHQHISQIFPHSKAPGELEFRGSYQQKGWKSVNLAQPFSSGALLCGAAESHTLDPTSMATGGVGLTGSNTAVQPAPADTTACAASTASGWPGTAQGQGNTAQGLQGQGNTAQEPPRDRATQPRNSPGIPGTEQPTPGHIHPFHSRLCPTEIPVDVYPQERHPWRQMTLWVASFPEPETPSSKSLSSLPKAPISISSGWILAVSGKELITDSSI